MRAHQPLLELQKPSQVGPDPRVATVAMEHFQAYFQAAVAMYTEEVGVSPIESSDGYMRHMRVLVQQGRCFAIVDEGGTVRWKSDIGVDWRAYCQIQGVWLTPELRGQGLAAPMMAAALEQSMLDHAPLATLYVNDYNAPALATYRRIGMERVGTFATILL